MASESSIRPDRLEDAPDHVLVDLARQNALFAMDVLVDRHYSAVLRFLTRQTLDCDLAQDLTQEVFTKAFTCLAQLKDDAAFLPWLYRIARNQSRSSRRGPNRMIRLAVINWINTETPSRMKPIAAQGRPINDIDEADVIQQVLDRLRSDYRELLLLRHVEGFSLDEVATIIGRSRDTTQRRINRAEASFRHHYAVVEARTDGRQPA